MIPCINSSQLQPINVLNDLNDLNLPREMQLLFQRGDPNIQNDLNAHNVLNGCNGPNDPNELTQFSSPQCKSKVTSNMGRELVIWLYKRRICSVPGDFLSLAFLFS
jgi:hypothetical protein